VIPCKIFALCIVRDLIQWRKDPPLFFIRCLVIMRRAETTFSEVSSFFPMCSRHFDIIDKFLWRKSVLLLSKAFNSIAINNFLIDFSKFCLCPTSFEGLLEINDIRYWLDKPRNPRTLVPFFYKKIFTDQIFYSRFHFHHDITHWDVSFLHQAVKDHWLIVDLIIENLPTFGNNLRPIFEKRGFSFWLRFIRTSPLIIISAWWSLS